MDFSNNTSPFKSMSQIYNKPVCKSLKEILYEKINSQYTKSRNKRMDKINERRFCNDNNKMEEDPMNSNEIVLDSYIKKIMLLYNNEDTKINFEIENLNNNHISSCPICSYPVLSIGGIVTCVSGCFEYKIPNEYFNENYSLDNCMDELMGIRKEHLMCESQFEVLLFQDRIMIYCVKCFNNNLLYV